MIVVRGARPADARGIAQVHAASWKDRYQGLLDPAYLGKLSEARLLPRWRAAIDDLARERDDAIFVATIRDRVVGFVCVGASRDAFSPWDAEVSMIYILREQCGAGLGRALMKAAADHSIRRGLFSTGLWVLRDNASARSFYEALGGELTGRKTDTVGGMAAPLVCYSWRETSVLAERTPPQVFIR